MVAILGTLGVRSGVRSGHGPRPRHVSCMSVTARMSAVSPKPRGWGGVNTTTVYSKLSGAVGVLVSTQPSYNTCRQLTRTRATLGPPG